jgi:ABC-type sugar transport system ATPase subunit
MSVIKSGPRVTSSPGDGAAAGGANVPLLQLNGIHKRFGGVRALNGARLTVRTPGTVHGLIGANGSGKSTLLGVLSGQLQPDAGTIRVDGQETTFASPVAAIKRGIAMVAQETAVAPELTVAENVLLGRRLVRRPAGLSWRATRARALGVLERLNLDYDPDACVRTLRPDQRQMVEIARALSLDSRVLILDEPTSSLSDDEVRTLFATVTTLKGEGVSTLFVSHRMAELFEICDELTVLRDGMTAGAGAIGDFSRDSLVALMVGAQGELARDVRGFGRPRQSNRRAGVALSVREFGVGRAVHDVSFDVHEGEIVGVAGLVGAGRSELLAGIFGAEERACGTVSVCGDKGGPSDARASIRRGVGFVPPERKVDGAVLDMGVRDNVLMVVTHRNRRLGCPRPDKYAPRFRRVAQILNLSYGSELRPVATLSGGNQQKVVLAKWLMASPRVLLLDEPTRGVDVSAKADIHGLLRELAAEGTALLVSSSENDELLALCDRILVMSRGSLVGIVDAAEIDEAELTSLAGGHS